MSRVLYKNVRQTLWKKWMVLFATGLIILMSSWIYTTMSYSVGSLEKPTLDYLENYRQEAFSIEMLRVLTPEEMMYANEQTEIPPGGFSLQEIKRYNCELFYHLMEERMNAVLSSYPDLELELRQMKDFYFNAQKEDHRALALKNATSINRSYIEEGVFPIQPDELAITKIYALKNHLSIGDTINLQGNNYTITGFVLFPDYTFPMFDQSFLIDNAKQTLLLFSDETYELIQGHESFRFSGLQKGETRSDFTENVIDTVSDHPHLSFILSVVMTQNQMRSGAIFDELRGGRIFSLGFSVIIASISILIVSLLVHKIMISQKGQIGVLRALGYTGRDIAIPYIVSVVYLALPTLLLGYGLGVLSAEPLKELYKDFYLLPSSDVTQNLFVFLTSIAVPLSVFTLFSSLIILRMLSVKPLDLINPHREDEVNRITRIANRLLRQVKPQKRYKYLYIARNTTKFLTFFIGIMFSTILILMAFMMNGMIERMTLGAFEQTAYRFQSFYDPMQGIPPIIDGQESFLFYPDVLIDSVSVDAVGLLSDNELHRLFDEKKNDLTKNLREGVLITKSFSVKQSIHEGDLIDIKIAGNTHSFAVKGIVNDYSSDRIYFDIMTLSRLVSDNRRIDLFSGIYSLSRPGDNLYTVIIDKDAVADQAQLMQEFMQYTVWFMVGISIVISVLILFVLTSVTVEDNYYNISLLKVMGYTKREVQSMILDSYLIYTLLSFAISVPIALLSLGLTMDYFTTSYNMVFPLEFQPSHILYALILLLSVFFAGTWNAKRKASKIPLQEILKAYRE